MHNVIAWMKSKYFYSLRVSQAYIITVLLVQPYWVLEIYANFTYFNNINQIFRTTRPLEPFFRYYFRSIFTSMYENENPHILMFLLLQRSVVDIHHMPPLLHHEMGLHIWYFRARHSQSAIWAYASCHVSLNCLHHRRYM
jgi:hypothetical protein